MSLLKAKQEEPYEVRISRTVPWEPKGEVPLGDPIEPGVGTWTFGSWLLWLLNCWFLVFGKKPGEAGQKKRQIKPPLAVFTLGSCGTIFPKEARIIS